MQSDRNARTECMLIDVHFWKRIVHSRESTTLHLKRFFNSNPLLSKSIEALGKQDLFN